MTTEQRGTYRHGELMEIDAQAMVDVLQAECQQQMAQKLEALAMFATARKRIAELEKQLAEKTDASV